MTDEQIRQNAIASTKRIIINLEESDFVVNVGWRSAEELRKYADDIAYDIYRTFVREDRESYNHDIQMYFVEAFKEF